MSKYRSLSSFLIIAVVAILLSWAPNAAACSVSCADGSECSGTWKCECVDGSASCTDQIEIEQALTTQEGVMDYRAFLSGYALPQLNPVIRSLDTMYQGLKMDDLNLYLNGVDDYDESLKTLGKVGSEAITDWNELRLRDTPARPDLK